MTKAPALGIQSTFSGRKVVLKYRHSGTDIYQFYRFSVEKSPKIGSDQKVPGSPCTMFHKAKGIQEHLAQQVPRPYALSKRAKDMILQGE